MKLHEMDEKTYSYSIPLISRISYILFAGIVFLGIATVPFETLMSAASILPLLLLLIALFGVGYRDTWMFDSREERVMNITGVFFLVRRKSYPFSSISRLEISHFTRGYREEKKMKGDRGRNRAMTVFALRLANDERKIIEIIGERKERGGIERDAMILSAATGLSLEKDRGYDDINPVHLSDIQ